MNLSILLNLFYFSTVPKNNWMEYKSKICGARYIEATYRMSPYHKLSTNKDATRSPLLGFTEPGSGGLSVISVLNCCCICSNCAAEKNIRLNMNNP